MSLSKKPNMSEYSHYLVGFGMGLAISALAFMPLSGSKAQNVLYGLSGVLSILIGGILGSVAQRKR